MPKKSKSSVSTSRVLYVSVKAAPKSTATTYNTTTVTKKTTVIVKRK